MEGLGRPGEALRHDLEPSALLKAVEPIGRQLFTRTKRMGVYAWLKQSCTLAAPRPKPRPAVAVRASFPKTLHVRTVLTYESLPRHSASKCRLQHHFRHLQPVP